MLAKDLVIGCLLVHHYSFCFGGQVSMAEICLWDGEKLCECVSPNLRRESFGVIVDLSYMYVDGLHE